MRKVCFGAWLVFGVSAANGADCVDTYDSAKDYFPHKAELQYAESFAIEYFNNYKVVTVHTPWPGAQEAVQYLLVQCGTPAPDGYDGVQRITVPLRRLAALSTTQLPHLELLDALENLVAVSDIEMVHSPGVNQRFAAGKIAEIGHGAGVNLELVLELETDVVMTVASAQSQYNAHPVLQQAGVAVAINAEYTEPSLLGRTEWLKFTAAFFNAEALAGKTLCGHCGPVPAIRGFGAGCTNRPTPHGVRWLPLARHLARRWRQELRSAIGRHSRRRVPVGRRRFRGKPALGL